MYVNAKKDSNDFPGIEIGDDSIENSGWKISDGWQGLVPAKSTLDDAKSVLGVVTGISELANGITYDFLEGKIRVTVLDDCDQIAKIWIDSQAPIPFNPPQSMSEATNIYGKFITTGVSRNDGAFFERPGLRVCCNAMDDTNPLLWMEIFQP